LGTTLGQQDELCAASASQATARWSRPSSHPTSRQQLHHIGRSLADGLGWNDCLDRLTALLLAEPVTV
jgi:hypothetical protein